MQCTFALSELPAYSYHYDGPEWPVSQVTENDFVAKVQKNACFNRTVQICQGRAIFQVAKLRYLTNGCLVSIYDQQAVS